MTLWFQGTVEEGLERLAGLGQLLGRLCTRPALLCDQTFLQVLLDCLLWFYVPVPLSAVQHKAKTWVVVNKYYLQLLS